LSEISKITGPVLVVGGSGQIGQNLLGQLKSAGVPATGTYFRNPEPGLIQLDASDPDQVMQVTGEMKPTLIINASNAQGGADACELEEGLADRYHFGNGKNLTDAAKQHQAKLVQISTDYVFDGEAGPYSETDEARPISKLGDAKLRLEQYMLQSSPDALVIRTSFVYSWTPDSKTKNFAMQVFESCRSGQSMRVPFDQVGSVTYAPNFSQALLEIAGLGVSGLFHIAGPTRCSKLDWALQMADFFELDPAPINGVSTEELAQAGPRPLESGFVLDKVTRELKTTRLMPLEEGLADMKLRMSVENTA
jgi:dTDP-4-dehydrorhamnose reductase